MILRKQKQGTDKLCALNDIWQLDKIIDVVLRLANNTIQAQNPFTCYMTVYYSV